MMIHTTPRTRSAPPRRAIRIDTRLGYAGRIGTTAAVVLMLAGGCSLYDITGDDKLPPDVTDPGITQTRAGAISVYNGTLAQFRNGFGKHFIPVSGVLSDELIYGATAYDNLDFRSLPESFVPHRADSVYSRLQRSRGQATQANALLAHYASDAVALRAHLYAIQGYSQVMLADLFCSGIPLSTIDYEGDYTLRPGSPTADVFRGAVTLFDSAMALAQDSVRFRNLARVGKGRALLSLGDFAGAALAVVDVPTDYTYVVTFTSDEGAEATNFAEVISTWNYSVSDVEGINGLDYRSSNDPRTRTTAVIDYSGNEFHHPDKYNTDGSTPIVLASGIEARLIEAEASLRAGSDSWLTILNDLRANAGVADLAPLTDPGTAAARVDMVFRERGFWLFLTGHRQGDLRRLIRQYGRSQDAVYPTGSYRGVATYGQHVNVAIPPQEASSNPHFSGCLNRGA